MPTSSGMTPNSEALHDPGGKVRIKLGASTSGSAVFSECGRYRPVLKRTLVGATKPGYVLFIGLNPSTASGDVDDPTVRRETNFNHDWGYGEYVKCNVMDYRATHPKDLLADGVIACSGANLPAIVELAAGAALVILAFGALHKKLAHHGDDVVQALAHRGIAMHCLGLTQSGNPRHPLYLRKDLVPVEFLTTRVAA
jgi:hypothetical protein